jgi:acyl-homoserine-lactone acylase
VTITRDEWGIAHVSGQTDADAVYGMIYAQAEDDFPRIERNYLVNLGRLSERKGKRDLAGFAPAPVHRPRTAQGRLCAKPAWLRKLMQAWADGLNAWLADHPKAKPLVLTHFEPWMALSFSEGSIGGDIERVPLSQLQAFYDHKQVAMTAAERGLIWQEPKGSNGIAIAPSRTKDGHALLLINPHTSFFFRSELQMTSREGLNAYGAVTWGNSSSIRGSTPMPDGCTRRAGSTTSTNLPKPSSTLRPGPKAIAMAGRSARLRKARSRCAIAAPTAPWRAALHHMGQPPRPDRARGRGKWIAFALMNKPHRRARTKLSAHQDPRPLRIPESRRAQGEQFEQHALCR